MTILPFSKECSDAVTAPRLTPPVLIGRASQLEELVEAVAHPPCLVVMTGEAGVGKTRMVAEMLAAPALRGRTHLLGRCVESQSSTPLAAVIEALSRLPHDVLSDCDPLAGALVPLLPELSAHLPPPPPQLTDPRADRHRQLRAAGALIETVGPAVLVLEDLHLADSGTREFLYQLTRSLPPQLSIITTTHRSSALAATPEAPPCLGAPFGTAVTELHLTPFTAEETGQFAACLLGADPVSEEFAQSLHRRTAGLPFAIEEVLRLLTGLDVAHSPDGNDMDRAGLPAPVRRDLLRRLGQLPPTARQVVAAAAVAAIPVSVDLLADVADLPEADVRRALSLALDRAVLHHSGAGTYDFRHPLARQAAYEAIDEPERPALHVRTARALRSHTAPLPLAQIAHHYRQAGRTEQWLLHTEAAGNRASAAGDCTGATEHFLTALRGHPLPGARIRLGLKLGRAALSALPHEGVVAALRRVIREDAPPPPARGELRLYLGTLLRNQAGCGPAGTAEIAGAVPDLVETAPHLAARAMSAVAIPSIQGWPLTEHLRWLDQAQQFVAYVKDPVQRTAIAANRASALMAIGHESAWRAAAELPTSSASAPEEAQLARAQINLAYATTALGYPEAARLFLTKATEILERNGTPYLDGVAETARLMLLWTTGDWGRLAERAAHTAARYADIPDLAAEALLVRGLLTLHTRGDSITARGDLLRAARTAQLDSGMVTTASAAAVALIHLTADRADEARSATDDAIRHIRRTGGWVWAADIAPTAVEALIRSGQDEQAESLTREFAQGIADRDAPAACAALITCRALLAEAAEHYSVAEQTFAEAEHAWRTAGRPYEMARVRELRGLCMLPHLLDEGERQLRAAIEGYLQIHASWDAKRCQRHLRRSGIVLKRRRGPLGYGDELSPRERVVAQLAAAGDSNREIAAKLNVSHRTVEHHVSKAMRKVGISSRAAFGARSM